MKLLSRLSILLLAVLGAVAFQACPQLATTNVAMSLYDAPVDDPLYAGVYLTITGITVNGKEVDDFPGKMTLEVSALQDGITAQLAEAKMAPGVYDEIALILDYDKDEKGEAPGCYIQTTYERKIDLANGRTGQETILISRSLDLRDGEDVNLIIDFDLRKTIRASQPGDVSEASLVPAAAIGQALRVVRESETGNVTGQLTLPPALLNEANTFVIYAYPAGTFDRSREAVDTDGDGITFEGAVTSTRAQVWNSELPAAFSLYYLEPGDYDLVFEAYDVIEFSQIEAGMLQIAGQAGLTVPVTVTRQQDASLELTGGALVP